MDIKEIYQGKTIDLTNTYELPKEYYENSEIIRLDPIKVKGKVYLENEEEHINIEIKGNMIINDSISLEEVDYPFTIKLDEKIEENNKKDENTLDIFQVLWENIVLEVPLQFTKVEDLSKFHGDGWKLISEDELKENNNPFRDLLKDYDKE